MVTANQVLTKDAHLSSDDKSKIRDGAEKIFREAVHSARVAMKNVEDDVKQIKRPEPAK